MKKAIQNTEHDIPAVRQDLFATIRRQMDETLDHMARIERDLLEAPLVHGFSIFPHGDRLQLRPFGTLLDKKGLKAGWREPFLRYELQENDMCVTAEVPGIRREDVKLDVGPDHIRLEAQGDHSNYRAFLEPGMSLDPERAQATCTDGVLQIRVPLKVEEAKRVRHIKVA